ncbi:putative B3 domain-containing protein At1g78640 [Ipomoea triloba]|uniref:putative B3 domain-containing protein At1g78640 n=1 Tax=Ipomoea triloba TaxID=35885 RepID=UPI00125DF2CE|nr:putative B3 domain-containing protein At1g78640 [Ipomoea triloba]
MAPPDNHNLRPLTFTLLSSPTRSQPPSLLHLFPDDGHWIKKRLSKSDVNSSSRLLLAKEDVNKYVLTWMDEERCAACESREGLRVKMWDLDTGSEHELSLKKWQTGSFLFTSNWSKEFVRRRNLQEGDCIGLRWDVENLGFFFHKFNAQS